jgi:hypothetical protein
MTLFRILECYVNIMCHENDFVSAKTESCIDFF